MKNRGIGKRLISSLLVAVIAASLCFSCTGCNLFLYDEIKNKVIDNTVQPVAKPELVRLIVNAISNKNGVSDSYSAIPEKQLNGISYSMFTEYVAILRSMSSKFGTIKSFRIAGRTESDEYLQSLVSLSGYEAVPGNFGKLDLIELDYGDTLKSENTKAKSHFFISEDDTGMAYLSKDYVTETVAAYNYLGHYFTMLENGNIDGLFSLLAPIYDSDIYINSVISAKAQYISEYYMLKVRSVRSEYIYDEITPFVVSVTIPKVIDDDGESMTNHTVTLVSRGDGNYDLKDEVPWYNDSAAVGIFDREGNAVRISDVSLNEERLTALLGTPYYFRVYEPTAAEEILTGADVKIRAVYPGIIVTILAEQENNGDWEGNVSGIVIYGDDYTVDNQITVGMNISELLLIYPMLDEAGYTFNYSSSRFDYALRFVFDDNNNIKSISILREELNSKR